MLQGFLNEELSTNQKSWNLETQFVRRALQRALFSSEGCAEVFQRVGADRVCRCAGGEPLQLRPGRPGRRRLQHGHQPCGVCGVLQGGMGVAARGTGSAVLCVCFLL